jgi:hypothetical protein
VNELFLGNHVSPDANSSRTPASQPSDDPGAFPRVLFQPEFFRLLAHLVLVPAQHVRRGRDSVAEGEGSPEIIEVHFGPGLT